MLALANDLHCRYVSAPREHVAPCSCVCCGGSISMQRWLAPACLTRRHVSSLSASSPPFGCSVPGELRQRLGFLSRQGTTEGAAKPPDLPELAIGLHIVRASHTYSGRMHARMRACMYVCLYVRACMHACVYACASVCPSMHARMHACIHSAYIRACMCTSACMHAFVHVSMFWHAFGMTWV